MTISFDIYDWELLALRDLRAQVNECIAARLTELGHQLPGDLLPRMAKMDEKENQRAWHDTFRALGYSKLETMRDEARACHRFRLHPAAHAHATENR